jgi:hypothetical protein
MGVSGVEVILLMGLMWRGRMQVSG